MLKKMLWALLILFTILGVYLFTWPVPVDPLAWDAPPNPGYEGVFESNEGLKELQLLPLGNNHGPEDIALDLKGRIYAATEGGWIIRLNADGTDPRQWANTGGRPLGIDFDNAGKLIVADAIRGLLSVAQDGSITELATSADGIPIRYADDVDVAADGKIYFSDASTKFGAKEFGGPYQASLLDLLEHGGHGRLMVYDPADGRTTTLLDNLNFANGVAVSPDQRYVLVNETGSYRVIRYWLAGPRKGETDAFIEALPGFPDNIAIGLEGRFWVALVSPRNALLDALSRRPYMRKLIQRFPAFLRPNAKPYGHIIAVNAAGQVVRNLQQPECRYPMNTSVTESEDYLYIGSLVAPYLGRLPKKPGH